jgi:uncharacterized protein (DUF433 family)
MLSPPKSEHTAKQSPREGLAIDDAHTAHSNGTPTAPPAARYPAEWVECPDQIMPLSEGPHMKLPDFLHENPHGEIRLEGHRIGLLHVVECYNEGCSAEAIHCEYPTLPLALIHKVIAFYLENQLEVDAYVAHCRAEIDRQAAAPYHGPSMRELRRRMAALKRAETA